MYDERMLELDREVEMINAGRSYFYSLMCKRSPMCFHVFVLTICHWPFTCIGTHPELSSLMREIHEKREQRLHIARAWRTHKGEIAQCQFEIAEYQAHCTFQVGPKYCYYFRLV